MTALPKGVSRKQINRLLELDEQIKAMEKDRDALKDHLKSALPDYVGNRTYGEVLLQFTEQYRFDPAAFAQDHDPITHPEFFSIQVDTEKVPDSLRGVYAKPVKALAVKRVS